jgi:hypothetical protein
MTSIKGMRGNVFSSIIPTALPITSAGRFSPLEPRGIAVTSSLQAMA